MQARSALFNLYGDHLRAAGGRAPVAALIQVLAPLEITAPAVRTAISRMVREGWLTPVRLPSGPGYALTQRAVQRLDEAAARIYRTRVAPWDGHWHVLVLERLPGRTGRERLRAGLTFLGYAPLGGAGPSTTWIAPRAAVEIDELLSRSGAAAHRFRAAVADDADEDAGDLVRRTWDLDALARAYDAWLARAREMVAAAGDALDDEQAFALRSRLVHEWRKFLFSDPGLPRELLPTDWAGDRAAKFFDAVAGRLHLPATRFVEACLGGVR
ncbi:MAG TPA: PaaX family transcriptional regulator C-terminal domain-containing protein [Actinopolymorphaceae bacterium]